ncbi:hypothetical protein [Helicobacter pylori]|uniref:hypothetical protein n=1 Tax=Helicobacter pylori TaxID=210 RepID=UPI0009A283AA|nr:hypothetical protein [Helicobacter pylori]OPG30888.1 hypothetical protein BGL61_06430 [Helicobacter pylori]
MEKLFEKILHEMRSSISVPLAFVVSFIVVIVDPKGVFHFIFESIFQYTQNKILSFFFIFLFFYAIFFIFGKVVLWYWAKKYKQNQIDIETALKIQKFPDKIKEELYHCYSKKQNKIPRTDELDKLIDRLDFIGFGSNFGSKDFSLRDLFEPTKDFYIVKPDVLRAIKKYHRIAFKSIYWQQNK